MSKSVTFTALLSLLWVGIAPLAVQAGCDTAAGKKQFNKCAACHSMEAGTHMMGPSLHGLMGREAGSLPGFMFSPAMEEADFVWSNSTLSAFLENPMQYVQGTTMPFGGIKKEEQRAALVCYLTGSQ